MHVVCKEWQIVILCVYLYIHIVNVCIDILTILLNRLTASNTYIPQTINFLILPFWFLKSSPCMIASYGFCSNRTSQSHYRNFFEEAEEKVSYY